MKLLKNLWFEVLLGIIGVGCIALTVGALWFGYYRTELTDSDKIANFVGGIATPLLTSITFIAVLLGVALQRRELIATREEMIQNRGEVARSAKALSDQVEAIKSQTFERTLFDSLRFLNEIVYHMKFKSRMADHPAEGRGAFQHFFNDLASIALVNPATYDGDELGADPALQGFMESIRPLLAVYFRTIYNIYRYLHESDYADRMYYSRIIRAQIDDFALPIIFYNSLTKRGLKFQNFIVQYDILDNMPDGAFLNGCHKDILAQMPTPQALVALASDGQIVTDRLETTTQRE